MSDQGLASILRNNADKAQEIEGRRRDEKLFKKLVADFREVSLKGQYSFTYTLFSDVDAPSSYVISLLESEGIKVGFQKAEDFEDIDRYIFTW